MKKITGLTGLAAVLLASGWIFALPLTAMAAEIPDGVFVGDIALGGMTEEEAKKNIDDHVNKLAKQKVTLEVEGTPVETTAEELGFFWSNREAVEEVTKIMEGGNMVSRYMQRKDLEVNPVKADLETSVDEAKVTAFVEEKCSGLAGEPQNATIVRANGGFTVTPGVNGKVVDIAATKAALDEAMAAGLDQPVYVKSVITEKEADITADDLATIGDVLGSFSTDFSSSGAARSKNLEVGSAKINGWVLMPGETLSGYECMQPFTTANGYYTAAAYENGQVVDSVGGGVCQIATTLYNASLLAELEITQRQNHSMTVAYVRPSMDAAIAGTFKDIKVTNNYSTPIYVEGVTSGRTLTFTFYGKETRPANREIKYVSETLGATDPGAPTERVDNSLAPGTRKQVQSAHRGLRSRLWKYVYVDGVETEKTLLHTDNYMASKAIVLVGPAAPEPVPEETQPAAPNPEETQPQTQAPAPVEGVQGGPGVQQPAPETTPAPTAAPETTPAPTAAPEPAPTPAPEPAPAPAAAEPEAPPAE